MGKKLKAKCCHGYKRKRKACKRCPLMAGLGKKERRRLIRKARK